MHFYICLFNIKADLVGECPFHPVTLDTLYNPDHKIIKKLSRESWSGYNMFNPILPVQP